MNIETYNDWYVRTDGRIGPWTITTSQQPTQEQIYNAQKVYDYFIALGWSLSAICGMIGNMMHESTLDPALIEQTHRSSLPNSATDLSDVPNSVMINFYGSSGYGIGLVQWDGYTSTAPAGQKLVSFAERYSYVWYDGDCQIYRIKREQETNIQWTSHTYYGITWTWSNYPTNNRTPEESARIWMHCYEVAAAGESERQGNARWWYDYFSGQPGPTPDDWISGSDFATLALAYDGTYHPYSEWDCITFVQQVWRDIDAVSNTDKLCNSAIGHFGTNTLWRENTPTYASDPNYTWTFDTTDPDGTNPTLVLWFKSDISSYLSSYDTLPDGCLLFHKIGEDDNPNIPPYYRGDGVGNFAHIGIYCGDDGNGQVQVMQSGGRDSSTIPGGGVHKTTYPSITSTSFTQAWNYMAFVVYVDPTGSGPIPPEPPTPDFPYWLYLWYINKRKKEVVRNVKRII